MVEQIANNSSPSAEDLAASWTKNNGLFCQSAYQSTGEELFAMQKQIHGLFLMNRRSFNVKSLRGKVTSMGENVFESI